MVDFSSPRWGADSCRRCGYVETDCTCLAGFSSPADPEPAPPHRRCAILVRRLYSDSCHGAGAEARWAARKELEALALGFSLTAVELLKEHDLDLAAYFASRPISRSHAP